MKNFFNNILRRFAKENIKMNYRILSRYHGATK